MLMAEAMVVVGRREELLRDCWVRWLVVVVWIACFRGGWLNQEEKEEVKGRGVMWGGKGEWDG